MNINIGTLITFLLYFCLMLGIGIYYYSKSKNLSDYILGGRSLNSWVAALSAQASDMSGWLLLGLPGAAYLSGLEAGWIAIGLLVGTYLNWKFIAKKLRIYTEDSGNSITIPDYLENRFRDTKKYIRIVSATFILIFFLIYTASGFVAGATLFETVFGLSYIYALTIGAIIVVGYTFLGGFSATKEQIELIDPNLLNIFVDAGGNNVTFIGVVSLLAWGIGYFGQPHILVRFMEMVSSVFHPVVGNSSFYIGRFL